MLFLIIPYTPPLCQDFSAAPAVFRNSTVSRTGDIGASRVNRLHFSSLCDIIIVPERLNFIKTEIKMKVTIVCEVLGKANNGTTVAALNLIRSLKEKGHSVKVICPDADREGLEGY